MYSVAVWHKTPASFTALCVNFDLNCPQIDSAESWGSESSSSARSTAASSSPQRNHSMASSGPRRPDPAKVSWKRCGHQTKEGLLDVSDRLDWKDHMVRLQHGHDRHSDVSQEQMRDCVPLDPPDIASCERLHQPWWKKWHGDCSKL